MLWLTLLMFVALVAAGFVALFVAYPHRGEQMPVAPKVGRAMRSAAERVKLVEDDEVRERVDRLARRR